MPHSHCHAQGKKIKASASPPAPATASTPPLQVSQHSRSHSQVVQASHHAHVDTPHSDSVSQIHMLTQGLQAAKASPKSKRKATTEPTKRNSKKPANPAPQPQVPPALDINTRPKTRRQASPHPLCLPCAPECIQGSHIYRRQNLISCDPPLHHHNTSLAILKYNAPQCRPPPHQH